MKKYLNILIGIPASGKSTFAKNVLSKDSTIISRDVIRYSMLKDGEEYFSHEKEVLREFINQIQALIDKGESVTADATHLNRYSRNRLIHCLTNLEDYEICGYFFTTPLEVCLERNSLREGRARVPDESIVQMYDNLTYPESCEKFDWIFMIDAKGNFISK